MSTNTISHEDEIEQLNEFLRDEIAAVETYDQALETVDHANAESILRANRDSHAARVKILEIAVQQRGGRPADGSGAWGALAKAVEGGARLFGESAAVTALEEGEDRGLENYQDDLDELTPTVRHIVQNELLREQQRTHETLSRLKSIMS